VYYYGASVSEPELRAKMPAYLLQWEMIRIARDAGCALYDFLGIAAPDDAHSHLAGVTDFKSKFGGRIEVLPPKYRAIFRPIAYYWHELVRRARSMIRK
jgi:peptidoglycan pentaglycine glycine transferase (the first glycine)